MEWKEPLMFAFFFGVAWWLTGGVFDSLVSPWLGALGTYASLATTIGFTALFYWVYKRFVKKPVESAL